MAGILGVPVSFLAKVLKKMAAHGLIGSVKGPYGGYHANEKSLKTTLMDIYRITDGLEHFSACILHFRKCNTRNPCPLHAKTEQMRAEFRQILENTRISDLLEGSEKEVLSRVRGNRP
jgi:Rrf2 family transcriptional regulator, iron-sulfur cluster assembly transcription factor